MSDSLFLSLAGILAIAGMLLAARGLDQRQRDHNRQWLRLRFPAGIQPANIAAFLAALGGLPRTWMPHRGESTVVFQVTGAPSGITHYLGVPTGQLPYVSAQLRASVPGIRLEDADPPSLNLTAASEVRLSDPTRELRTDDPAAASASLLASMQPLQRGEALTMQWLVAPAVTAPVRSDGTGVNSSVQLMNQILRGTRKPDPEVVKAARDKARGPLFRVVGRVGVVALDKRRQAHLLWRVIGLLHSLRRPGVTLRRRFLPSRLVVPRAAEARTPWLAYPVRLSAVELLSVIGWPIDGRHLAGLSLAGSTELPPDPAIPRTGRVIAEATFPGAERPLAISARDATTHMWCLGPTGTGKTTVLARLILADIAAGRSVVVIDPKDLVADVVDRIPPEHQSRVIVLDPTDERPVGLNPLYGAHEAPELVTDQIVGLFHNLYSAYWGPRTADILHSSLLTLATDPSLTLAELPTLLVNDAARRLIVGRIDDPLGLNAFWGWYERLKPGERSAALGPVMNKLRPLLLRRRIRNCISQAVPTFTMPEVLSKPMVLLVSLQRGLIGPEAAALLGSIVVSMVWQAIQARGALPPSQRQPAFFFIDEAQTFINLPVDLADAFATARSLGVGIVAANQNLGQLPHHLREVLMANARSFLAFQSSPDDAPAITRRLGGGVTAEDLRNLEPYQAYLSLYAKGRVRAPVSARTLPLPPSLGSAAEVRAASRQRFGRDRAEVEAEILQRHRMGDPSGPIGRMRRQS